MHSNVFMNRKIFFLLFYLLILSAFSFLSAEESPLLTAEGRLVQISQNSAATLMALTFEDRVAIYDTTDYKMEFVINQENVVKTSFYTENGSEYIALMTKNGSFKSRRVFYGDSGWSCDYENPYFTAECADSSKADSVTAVAFSRNADYVAAAFSDGSIQVHFRLRVTQKLISRLIKEHLTSVYGLEFNSTGEYLASVSLDGTANIWNCYSNTRVAQLKGVYARGKIPVCFTEDSVYIVSLDGKNSFRISDFSGNTLFSILTGRPITAIKPLKNPDLIAVRNDKNEVMVYSISSRRPISVSSVNESLNLTAFEFDFAAELMYAGFADGRLCSVEPEPYLDEKSLLVTDSSLAEKGSGNMSANRFQSFSLDVGANYLARPYLLSGNVRLEYRYCDKTAPWFIGLGLLAQAGLPRKDFPYSYTLSGSELKAPYLCSAAIYLPTGFIFSPWNNSISFVAAVRAGAKINSLSIIYDGYMIGTPSYSFFVSGGAGMIFKFFELEINCEYDTIGKLSPSVYAGVCLKWGNKK